MIIIQGWAKCSVVEGEMIFLQGWAKYSVVEGEMIILQGIGIVLSQYRKESIYPTIVQLVACG